MRLTPGGQVFETVVAAKPITGAVRVDGDEARTTAGTGGDPFRVIESLPGVSQIVWPFALYAIRGANPGNTGFFLDGMRVPALFHFALGPSIVHPYLIDKLSFYPGGYPARLGGYVSGAVSAETAAPPHDITRYSADVRLYDAGGLVAAPWDGGRGTIAVAARYAYTGLIVSRLFGNVDFGYADYQLRADHPLGGGRATLLALGSFDHLDIKDQNIGDASLNYHRLDLRWDRPVAGGTFFARTALGTDAATSQLYDSPLRVRGYSVAPRLAYSHPIGRAHFEVGADAEAQRFDADVNFDSGMTLPGTMPQPPPMLLADLARDRNALSVRGYVAATIPFKRLSLEPGLRYAQYFEQGVTRGAWEPRLTVRLAIVPALAVDATVGRFSQMPSLPVGVAGFEAFGLRDFGLQRSTQAALGVEARLPADLTLRLTGFHQWLLVSDMRSTFAHDVTTPEFLQMRNGRGYGAELLLRLPDRGRVHGWLAYTLSWSTARVRRRVRAVGLGPAPHPQPGERDQARAGLVRGRPLPLQHRPPLSGERRVPAAPLVLADRSTRRQARRVRPQHLGLLHGPRERDVQPAGDGALGGDRPHGHDEPAPAGRLPHRAAVDRRARRVVKEPPPQRHHRCFDQGAWRRARAESRAPVSSSPPLSSA